jgi:hypothetical protein
MSRKTQKELAVSITFKPSRIKNDLLMDVYETVLPINKREVKIYDNNDTTFDNILIKVGQKKS